MRPRAFVCLNLLALLAASAVVGVLSLRASGRGMTTMRLGSSLVLDGKAGALPGHRTRATGQVLVAARWGDGGRWLFVRRVHTDGHGAFHLSMKPSHAGILTVRVDTPDEEHHLLLLRIR